MEVAISLCAIDRMLQTTDQPKDSTTQPKDLSQGQATNTLTMKDHWTKWTMEHHRFSNIKLTPEFVTQFTGGVKEYLEKEELDGVECYVMLSLKYFFPAKPKPKESTKPLTR